MATNWKRTGWPTVDKKPVKNIDFWEQLDAELKSHSIKWVWVKGHAGHPENERVDELARLAVPPAAPVDDISAT